MAGFFKWVREHLPDAPREPDWARYRPTIAAIGKRRQELAGHAELAPLARAADPQNIVDCFALAAEALHRGVGLDPFEVQIAGALAMHDGAVAEMQTGEGKTASAVMTVFANAIGGAGAHVWTANDYLARRDAVWMGPAYRMLGLTVASISQHSTREERRAAYACDVTYQTANEAGFDYLRDQLVLTPDERVQRPYAFVLIDEADSILIDEARIPLVIAGEAGAPAELAHAAARAVCHLREGWHYFTDGERRNVWLTDAGAAKVETALGVESIYDARQARAFSAVQDALHAEALLRRDVDYLVRNGSVELIDEFKGRVALDRRWPAGLQTALEAKEGLELRKQGRILGSMTLQSLVRRYPRVCGMTGTAATQASEFAAVYGLRVIVIPPNRPVIREDLPDVLFTDKAAKERAVVDEIAEAHAAGRPVLVGTASVEESERLSARATLAGIPHQVLNARNDEVEAAIVARAGELGAVTISTNMAGRGTDIPLASDAVRELGGLYVIGMNRHEARRIDYQLRGRAGRQGDPGLTRFFVSLDDDLMLRYGIREALHGIVDLPRESGQVRSAKAVAAVESVQRVVEGQNLEIRRTLWKYDGLADHHEREMHARRAAIVDSVEISERERRVTLITMDDLWSDYLAAVAELRAGIHWESWSGKDPLYTFLTRASEIYAELNSTIESEVAEALAKDESQPIEDLIDRSATWTYLISDQPFGTLQQRWARAVRERVRAFLAG